jgi:hypothetical protein
MAGQLGGTHGVTLWFDPASIVVNPHSGLSLHSVAVRPVSSSFDVPIPFMDPGAYLGDVEDWMTQQQFNSLKVGVRLQFQRIGQPNAPLITLYREYEAIREHEGVYGL